MAESSGESVGIENNDDGEEFFKVRRFVSFTPRVMRMTF